jgi:hypothetical protein
MKTDNYAENLLYVLKSKKYATSAIKRCAICDKSEIWIAAPSEDHKAKMVYSSADHQIGEKTLLSSIKTLNSNDDGVMIYRPSRLSL